MKITRDNVAKYAKDKGLDPYQEDGIPEGFSWKEPDIQIGKFKHKGKKLKFKPLADWQDEDSITYE